MTVIISPRRIGSPSRTPIPTWARTAAGAPGGAQEVGGVAWPRTGYGPPKPRAGLVVRAASVRVAVIGPAEAPHLNTRVPAPRHERQMTYPVLAPQHILATPDAPMAPLTTALTTHTVVGVAAVEPSPSWAKEVTGPSLPEVAGLTRHREAIPRVAPYATAPSFRPRPVRWCTPDVVIEAGVGMALKPRLAQDGAIWPVVDQRKGFVVGTTKGTRAIATATPVSVAAAGRTATPCFPAAADGGSWRGVLAQDIVIPAFRPEMKPSRERSVTASAERQAGPLAPRRRGILHQTTEGRDREVRLAGASPSASSSTVAVGVAAAARVQPRMGSSVTTVPNQVAVLGRLVGPTSAVDGAGADGVEPPAVVAPLGAASPAPGFAANCGR